MVELAHGANEGIGVGLVDVEAHLVLAVIFAEGRREMQCERVGIFARSFVFRRDGETRAERGGKGRLLLLVMQAMEMQPTCPRTKTYTLHHFLTKHRHSSPQTAA